MSSSSVFSFSLAYALLFNKTFAFSHGLGCEVFQHFQLVFTLADERSQGDGYGQSYHAGAGNANPHGIFQDIAT